MITRRGFFGTLAALIVTPQVTPEQTTWTVDASNVHAYTYQWKHTYVQAFGETISLPQLTITPDQPR